MNETLGDESFFVEPVAHQERICMCRNEFDASHWCSVAERDVHFIVFIGNIPECPECHQIVDLPKNAFVLFESKKDDIPQNVEETEEQ